MNLKITDTHRKGHNQCGHLSSKVKPVAKSYSVFLVMNPATILRRTEMQQFCYHIYSALPEPCQSLQDPTEYPLYQNRIELGQTYTGQRILQARFSCQLSDWHFIRYTNVKVRRGPQRTITSTINVLSKTFSD